MHFPNAHDHDAKAEISLPPDRLVELYNALSRSDRKMSSVTETVKRWARIVAHRHGWRTVRFVGKRCVLKSDERSSDEDTQAIFV